jgi:acyl carrier protein
MPSYQQDEMLSGIMSKIKELFNVQSNFGANDDLTLIGLDSLRFVNLIVVLEEMYDVSFDDDEFLVENFTTVQKIIDRIHGKLA